jgi:hypothetical protein
MDEAVMGLIKTTSNNSKVGLSARFPTFPTFRMQVKNVTGWPKLLSDFSQFSGEII